MQLLHYHLNLVSDLALGQSQYRGNTVQIGLICISTDNVAHRKSQAGRWQYGYNTQSQKARGLIVPNSIYISPAHDE